MRQLMIAHSYSRYGQHAHPRLNLITIFFCSISLGMIDSLHSLVKNGRASARLRVKVTC